MYADTHAPQKKPTTLRTERSGGLGALVWLAALTIAGCGGDRLPTAPVSGVVRLGGAPLTAGTIVFTPTQGRAARGTIQPDGSYRLGTYAESDGAIVGQHIITVLPAVVRPDPTRDAPPAFQPSPIPPKYADPQASGLTLEVPTDGLENADFELSAM